MDRDGKEGRLSRLECEAYLHELIFWAVSEIETLKPAVFLLAETAQSAHQ